MDKRNIGVFECDWHQDPDKYRQYNCTCGEEHYLRVPYFKGISSEHKLKWKCIEEAITFPEEGWLELSELSEEDKEKIIEANIIKD